MGGLTADDYAGQLAALLPLGPAWKEAPGVDRLLGAEAEALARVDRRSADLVRELDPRTTHELLGSWERQAGLPDECTVPGGSMAARRDALVAKLLGVGGQSRAYFIGLAEAFGYPGTTITEFRPFTCQSACDDSLDPDPWRFVWRVNLPKSAAIRQMDAESTCVDALAEWGDTTIECVINRLKPAHTLVQFAYQEA
ncbi:hypothetical protein A9J41_14040 [Laribacter hongkongensis]|uniref:YmfQ family protein n=1 Tax=Laribacter hongkongensis TaxID=168471 RepID=UPI0018782398|nr:putative phage tail protein [Laribacter hongkongensis]MBE5528858.1 hypothetical protein [Laribacter hongkongensis]